MLKKGSWVAVLVGLVVRSMEGAREVVGRLKADGERLWGEAKRAPFPFCQLSWNPQGVNKQMDGLTNYGDSFRRLDSRAVRPAPQLQP